MAPTWKMPVSGVLLSLILLLVAKTAAAGMAGEPPRRAGAPLAGPPVELSALASSAFVSLAWTAPPEGAEAYKVYRGGSPAGPFELLGETPLPCHRDDDPDLVTGTTYYYKVSSVLDGEESGYSDVAWAALVEAHPCTEVTGPIESDTVWTLAESPVCIGEDLTVESSEGTPVTLTIERGVEVIVEPGAVIALGENAALAAEGTACDPVRFVSGAAFPRPGDWDGVKIDRDARVEDCHFVFCEFRHAKQAIQLYRVTSDEEKAFEVRSCTFSQNFYGVQLTRFGGEIRDSLFEDNNEGIHLTDCASPTIRDSDVRANGSVGIYLRGDSSPVVQGNRIVDNGRYGLRLRGSNTGNPAPIILDNQIHGNLEYNLHAADYDLDFGPFPAMVQAEMNDWGTDDPVLIAEGIHDYAEERKDPPVIVDFIPFLDANGLPFTPPNVYLGALPGSTSWQMQGDIPVRVLGPFIVPVGSTLIIQPGTRVEFVEYRFLRVDGALQAIGEEGNEVVLTSTFETPEPGHWYGVAVFSGGSVRLDRVTLNYAQAGLSVIAAAGVDVEATRSVFAWNEHGIHLETFDAAVRLSIADCEIHNNEYGLYVIEVPDPTVSLSQSRIHHNGRCGAYIRDASPTLIENAFQWNGTGIEIRGGCLSLIQGNAIGVEMVPVPCEARGNDVGIKLMGTNDLNPTPTVIGNTIAGNERANVRASAFEGEAPVTQDMERNAWCSVDPHEIAAGIEDASVDPDQLPYVFVDFVPFLDPGGDEIEPPNVVFGMVGPSTVLDDTSHPYLVVGSLIVPIDAALSVGEGVTLAFSSDRGVRVHGSMTVSGSEASPAVFTAGGSEAPEAGDWYGIKVLAGGTLDLVGGLVEWARYGVEAVRGPIHIADTRLQNNYTGLDLEDVNLTDAHSCVERSTIRWNDTGIRLYMSSPCLVGNTIAENAGTGLHSLRLSRPVVVANDIVNNGGHGVYLQGSRSQDVDPVPTRFRHNNVHGNGGGSSSRYDLYAASFFRPCEAEGAVNARDNYWGTCVPEEVAARVYGCEDNDRSPVVLYEPFLCEPHVPEAPPSCVALCSECEIDPDCDDGHSCTADVCNDNHFCEHLPQDDLCLDEGECGLGICDPEMGCRYLPQDDFCDDGVPCTEDRCGPASLSCEHEPLHADCDDGIWCNGAEVCDAVAGCLPGTERDCGDGLPCTVDTCDEEADACAHLPDSALCDDGAWCNGAETCDALAGCLPGTAPDCADAVPCTVDGCDEATDTCTHLPDDAACTDGAWCNGAEVCDVLAGCQDAPPPDCDDGIPCTVDTCDEEADACAHQPVNAVCDDDAWCNGVEVCDVVEGCRPGEPACPDDGDFCNGPEVCDEIHQRCGHSGDPCTSRGLLCDATEAGCIACMPLPLEGFHGELPGGDEHQRQVCVQFVGEARDLSLSCTVYDVDYEDEVAIYLNGTLLRHAPTTEDGGYSDPVEVTLPEALLQPGQVNPLIFRNSYNPPHSYKWAVGNVSIDAGDALALIGPGHGATVSEAPVFSWSANGYDAFGLFLYLPVLGTYYPFPAAPPLWTVGHSFDLAPYADLWDWVTAGTWMPWFVVGVSTETEAWEVAGPWWIRKGSP